MVNIIKFEDAKFNLNEDDIFNLFIIHKNLNENYLDVNLELLMKSLGKYKDMDRFKALYRNLSIKIDDEGIPYVDLTNSFKKLKKEKKILEYPNRKNIFFIIMNEENTLKLKEKYNEYILYLFDLLMFNVLQDFEYGLNGWELIDEVEYIKHPNYPGVVTSKFIGKKKTERILKKVKKMAIDNLKNKTL